MGTQLIAALLRDGTAVHTTVRSLDREAGLRKAVRRGRADNAGLEVVTADLMAEAPGDELPELVIHNERAKRVLGWRPRPAETTITETAEACATSDSWNSAHESGYGVLACLSRAAS